METKSKRNRYERVHSAECPKPRPRGYVTPGCRACAYMQRNRERIADWYERPGNWEKHLRYANSPRGRFAATKGDAKRRGILFQVSSEQFEVIVALPCSYCGKHWATGNGLDRVDSDKGYTIDNVVSCCARCNRMKRDDSLADFAAHVLLLASRFQGTKEGQWTRLPGNAVFIPPDTYIGTPFPFPGSTLDVKN